MERRRMCTHVVNHDVVGQQIASSVPVERNKKRISWTGGGEAQ